MDGGKGGKMDGYTKSKLRNEVLYMTAISNCLMRKTIAEMNRGILKDKSVPKQLALMFEDGLIENMPYGKKKNGYVRIKRQGLELLQEKDPRTYAFYMENSSNGSVSWDSTHLEPYLSAADIHYLMYRSGIRVGTQKPRYSDIKPQGQHEQLDFNDNVFYLFRECRKGKDKVINVTGSRGSGVLITEKLTGIVYRVRNTDMRISPELEGKVNIRSGVIITHLCKEYNNREPSQSILVGDDYSTALGILYKEEKENQIKRAIANPSLTGTSIHFVPLTMNGVTVIKTLSQYDETEIVNNVFTREEIDAARNTQADAYIETADLDCYEAITNNLTKLNILREIYDPSVKTVRTKRNSWLGLACYEFQKPFLKELFKNTKLRFRTIDSSTFIS